MPIYIKYKTNNTILLLICLFISSYGSGQSEIAAEMPIAQFIDIGFRIELTGEEADEVLVVGEKLAEINILHGASLQDTIFFRRMREFVFDNLLPFQLKFPETERMDIIKKYLAKRNSEEILNDGFYIGCGDVCTVIGALLMKYGYDCKLAHAVSSKFSNTYDIGHVFLYITKDGNKYLYDPSMSNDIITNYNPDTAKTIKIRSAIGDLFVFCIDHNPKRFGILDMDTLNKMRTIAFNYWHSLDHDTFKTTKNNMEQ